MASVVFVGITVLGDHRILVLLSVISIVVLVVIVHSIVHLSWDSRGTLVHALLFELCRLDVDLSAQDVGVLNFFDEILGYFLILENDEAEAP